jgi:replicative superfamily II helicase
MVDFNKLRGQHPKTKAIDPVEVFRRLPKPTGINDLYTSQAEVLQSWFAKRGERDTIVKLHTGGGKTLVGLLMAQSTLNETGGPVLYLAPNRQLVAQTIEKARAIGIAAVEYSKGLPLDSAFANGQAIMVATYSALFNGRSKFGVRGGKTPQSVSAIILDDAHVSFGLLRDAFTLEVLESQEPERYRTLVSLFRQSFSDIERLGSFDDTVSGKSFGVMEVPHTAWLAQLVAVRAQLKECAEEHALEWPLLRDNLHLCHALISRKSFTITPILPIVSLFPTFADAPRRIYMSATISDESDIIRNFDADPKAARNALTSRSLAGVSERMILIPELMPFKLDVREAVNKLLQWVAERKQGAVVLVQSDPLALEWSSTATVAVGASSAESHIQALQNGKIFGPVVFSNRYDGMDLPGDSCRFLLLASLCESELPYSQMEDEANRLLSSSKIRSDRLISNYLQEFTR